MYLFIYFWLCWVFVSVRGLSPVVVSGGHSSSRCAGLSLARPLFLRSTGSRRAGSVVVAHGPSCSVACGIFPNQGSNPCPLHWQSDSQPLPHQGSPTSFFSMATQQSIVLRYHNLIYSQSLSTKNCGTVSLYPCTFLYFYGIKITEVELVCQSEHSILFYLFCGKLILSMNSLHNT